MAAWRMRHQSRDQPRRRHRVIHVPERILHVFQGFQPRIESRRAVAWAEQFQRVPDFFARQTQPVQAGWGRFLRQRGANLREVCGHHPRQPPARVYRGT
jgi:hypothetical protein